MDRRCVWVGLLLTAGCVYSRLVAFPLATQVEEIRVKDLVASSSTELKIIRDPRQIDAILTFLQTTEGTWVKPKATPTAGRYSLALTGDNVRLYLRAGNGILVLQGATLDAQMREVSEEEEAQLLRLVGIERSPDESGSETRAARLTPEEIEAAELP